MGIWLVMQTVSDGERPFEINKASTVIGRAPASDLRIAVPSVAPRHCELRLMEDELKLVDLARRGILHNGNPVREAVLEDTDELKIGPVTFHVRCTVNDEEFTAWPESNGHARPSSECEVKPG